MRSSRDYDLNTTLSQQRQRIGQQAAERRRQRLEAERLANPMANDEPLKIKESIRIPARVTNRVQLAQLLKQLQELEQRLSGYAAIDIEIELQDE